MRWVTNVHQQDSNYQRCDWDLSLLGDGDVGLYQLPLHKYDINMKWLAMLTCRRFGSLGWLQQQGWADCDANRLHGAQPFFRS